MRLKETRFRPPMFEQPRFQASTSSEPPRFQTTSPDPLRFPASVSEPPGFQTGFQTSFPTTPPLPPVLHPLQLPPQLPSPRPRADPAPRRLVDFPAYEGGNADDWLFRLEQCFLSNQTPEDEKLDKAISCLTGPAVTWWRCSREREQIYAWRDFQERFRVRFRQSRGSSAIDHLFNIRQTGSVEEYRERFEELTVDLPHVTSDILESAFLNGLRRNLKDQVVRCRPVNLADIVEIAKLIESQERNNLSYQVRNPNRVSFQPPTVQASSTIRAQDRSGGKQIVSSTRDTTRASGSGEARNPNPCRNCAERWFPGHKCK